MRYDAEVTYEDGVWLADVVGLPGAHTFARSLHSLDANVREVIAMVEDLPRGAEGGITVDYSYRDVPEVVAEAARIGAERAALAEAQRIAHDETLAAASKLSRAGLSARDAAHLLRLSPGRISQLIAQRHMPRV
jgi:uncharacterized membrane protein YeiH